MERSNPLFTLPTYGEYLEHHGVVVMMRTGDEPGVVIWEAYTTSFTVRVADQYNWSGVRLKKGQTYRFDMAAGEQWQDGDISCAQWAGPPKDCPGTRRRSSASSKTSAGCPKPTGSS